MFRNRYPLVSIMEDLLGIRSISFFLLLCLVTFLVLFIKKNFIEYEISAFQILDERGELGMFKVVTALQYFSIPVVYILKFSLIAFLLWVASFGFGYKVTYAQCWQIAMTAEIVFVIPELLKVGWFFVFRTDPIFAEVRAFYPFSLMNFFQFDSLPSKWHYPLKAINLFEVVYWWMIAAGIYIKSNKSYHRSLYICLFGYIIPFFFWLIYYVNIYD